MSSLSVAATPCILEALRAAAGSDDESTSPETKTSTETVRQYLLQHSKDAEDLCDDIDQEQDKQRRTPWRHQTVPVAVLRAAAALRHQTLRGFLLRCHRLEGSSSSRSNQAQFVLAAETKTFNPRRRQMRARIGRINAAVEAAEYNEMLASSVPPEATGSHGGTTVVPNRVVGAIDGTIVGGKPVKLGGALGEAQRGAVARSQPETLGVVLKDVSIGIDMRLMSIAGAIFGYYVNYVRGMSPNECIVGAGIGAVAMLFVDALLLMIRMSKDDGKLKPRRVFFTATTDPEGASSKPTVAAPEEKKGTPTTILKKNKTKME